MSVIGRLDEQVNDILINPLSRRRRDEEGPAPPSAPGADPPPAPPDVTADKDETVAGHDELPVWML
jgi:hypothetical protein